MVNQIRLSDPKAVPMALFALEVQRGSIPGAPGELDKLNILSPNMVETAAAFQLRHPAKLGLARLSADHATSSPASALFIGPACLEFRDQKNADDHQGAPCKAGNGRGMLFKANPTELVEQDGEYQLACNNEAD